MAFVPNAEEVSVARVPLAEVPTMARTSIAKLLSVFLACRFVVTLLIEPVNVGGAAVVSSAVDPVVAA